MSSLLFDICKTDFKEGLVLNRCKYKSFSKNVTNFEYVIKGTCVSLRSRKNHLNQINKKEENKENNNHPFQIITDKQSFTTFWTIWSWSEMVQSNCVL